MLGAERVGPGPADLIAAEKSLSKRVQPHGSRQPHELRVLRDLLWRWLRGLGLSDQEISRVCTYSARSRWTVGDRLEQLEEYLEDEKARSEGRL
jgi:hypothetical protein